MARLRGAAPVSIEHKLLLTVAEAAGLCSVSRDRAYELVHTDERYGGWRVVQIGHKYLIPRQWLVEWVESEAARQSDAG
jgi:excisionase family DNA binding protein